MADSEGRAPAGRGRLGMRTRTAGGPLDMVAPLPRGDALSSPTPATGRFAAPEPPHTKGLEYRLISWRQIGRCG